MALTKPFGFQASQAAAPLTGWAGDLGTGFTATRAWGTLPTSDGGLIVNGQAITQYKGSTYSNEHLKLDSSGNIDSSYTGRNTNSAGCYRTIELGGVLYTVGFWTNFTPYRFMKTNLSTGALDSTFSSNVGTALNSSIRGITTDGTSLFVAGNFTSPQTRLAKYSTSGVRDTGWTANANGYVYTIEFDTYDNTFIIGGEFTSVNGAGRNYVAKLNLDGSLNSWNPGASGFCSTAIPAGNGEVFIGAKNGAPKVVNQSGTTVSSFGNTSNWKDSAYYGGLTSGGDFIVPLPDGFSTFDGTSVTSKAYAIVNKNGLVSAHGTKNSSTLTVYSVSPNNDNPVVSGNFTSIDSTTRGYVAAFDSSGNLV